MVPIVFFTGSLDYHRYEFNDFEHSDGVTVVHPYPFKIGGVRYHAWKAIRAVAYRDRRENFPRCWFRRLVKRHATGGAVAFCFTNASFEYYNEGFVRWLRGAFPGARMYAVLVDNIEGRYGEFLRDWSSRCDGVFSFDRGDCLEYGWHHFWGLMPTTDHSWFTQKENGCPDGATWDICFIGTDKGRYPEIRSMYERLSDGGIRCLFRILSDRAAEDETDRKILMRQKMSFREMLSLEGRSGILLEYGARTRKDQGLTLRVMDAVGWGCGIITNNPNIVSCPVYHPDKIAVVESFDDITPEMVRRILSAGSVPYQHIDTFGASNIINVIEREMTAYGGQPFDEI